MDDFLASAHRRVDGEAWARMSLFNFFKEFAEPYHGVCIRVDCTTTYRYAKEHGLSVALAIEHRALAAAQRIENLRLRIVGEEVWLYDQIHGSSAVGRPDETIGFAYYRYSPALERFVREAAQEVERVRRRNDLARNPAANVIRFSTLPWLDFTSISHARHFGLQDSAPRITFGKITVSDERRTMPVSIHLHHGLADGLHAGQFVEHFQSLLDAPEEA